MFSFKGKSAKDALPVYFYFFDQQEYQNFCMFVKKEILIIEN